jgi:hypothetical protein
MWSTLFYHTQRWNFILYFQPEFPDYVLHLFLRIQSVCIHTGNVSKRQFRSCVGLYIYLVDSKQLSLNSLHRSLDNIFNYKIQKTSPQPSDQSPGGGSLGLEVGTHVRQQNRVKGGCFWHGAGCSNMAKVGCFFQSSLENGTLLEFGENIT